MREQVEHVRREPVKLDPTVEAGVRAYVAWKLRQPSARQYADDIVQEAYLVALERRPPLGFLFQECVRHVGREMVRARVPVSLPDKGPSEGGPVASDFLPVHVNAAAGVPSPITTDGQVEVRRILARWLEIKAELVAAEAAAASDLPPVVRAVGAAVLEARAEDEGDGIRGVHVALARQHGITPQRVARAVTRYERAIDRSPAVARARREMRALQREARS